MKKLLAFFSGILILGLALAAAWYLQRGTSSPQHVSGTIETDETHVASRYGGRVAQILAAEGNLLHSGQVIMELEAPELAAQRAQTAALLEELVAGPRPEELLAAQHDWESMTAELEFARAEDKRTQDLFRQNTLSETERDRAASRARVLEKSVAAAKSRYDLLLAGTRPERIAQVKAQLAEIETRRSELRIVAPTNSILEVLHVKVGDVLAPNRAVATLLLPDHLWVRVYAPEPWLGFIKLGQAVKVRVDSFPEREFQGQVEQINRTAEFTPRNVQTVEERIKQVIGVKVRLPAPEGLLRAGMAAEVVFRDAPK
ncbi:MAG: efflux RND transporter periplasmic adaptor subunit [Verrucomicrobiota bacterium]